jgi:hypothetical protein
MMATKKKTNASVKTGSGSLPAPPMPPPLVGKYSGDLPGNLLGSYIAARGADDLLCLSEQIALLDARTSQVLADAKRGESAGTWNEALRAVAQLRHGLIRRDKAEINDALRRLEALEDGRGVHANAMREIRELVELRRKLVATEARVRPTLDSYVSVADANRLIGALLEIVKDEVEDARTLTRIANRFLLVCPPARSHSASAGGSPAQLPPPDAEG